MSDIRVRREHEATPESRPVEPRSVETLREILRATAPLGERVRGAPALAGFAPAFEIEEVPGGYLFRADVPGVKEQDLEVVIARGRLSVAGKREADRRDEGDAVYTSERAFGDFARSFALPEELDGASVEAELEDGVLTIRLERACAPSPRP